MQPQKPFNETWTATVLAARADEDKAEGFWRMMNPTPLQCLQEISRRTDAPLRENMRPPVGIDNSDDDDDDDQRT
jgi:hypothetical protein